MSGGSKNPKTLAVHAGSQLRTSRSVPIVPAIHISTVSHFEDDSEALDGALDGKDYVYSRITAQNTTLLEEAIAALEGTEDAVVYASGMAAVRAVVDAEGPKAGDSVVISADGYGVTRLLLKTLADARGFDLVALKLSDPASFERIRSAKPKLVLAESVTNPLLSVPDVTALADVCHSIGAALAVDGTFPSPALQQAVSLGADYAIQSTTKWLNGHSDALGGSVAASKARVATLKRLRLLEGSVIGPFEAWLTLRGVRTLPLRMKAHSEHAAHVAARLAQSPLLDRVYYPGLPEDENHAVARRMLTGGFGGMVAFEIKGADRQTAFGFLEAVKLARAAPSLGDVATLVMHAASASARRMTPSERAAAGIRDNLIRVSVGLEDPDEIADDLLQAVAAAVGHPR